MELKSTKQWVLAGVIFGISLTANAVGLGKLTVVSALGQALNAEIELVSVQKEELASLSVRMAAPSAFQQANIEYAGALAKIKFSVETRNGKPYIKVTSPQAINDPFVDMLVEVNWASGRLLREYTFLLDPPGFGSSQPVEPVPAIPSRPLVPETQATPQVTPAPAPQVLPQNIAPMQPNAEEKPVVSSSRKGTPPKAREIAGAKGEAYTTQRGDTLSKVATSVKPEGVSLDQMLIALYRANPSAFEGKNINRLKAGQTLNIPDQEQVMSISAGSAAKEVRVHSSDWRAYRQKLAGMASDSGTDKSQAPQQSASGKVSTTVEDKATPNKEPAKDQLRLSKNEPANAKSGGSGATDRKAQDRINALQEEAIAKDKAVKEANSRVADLEKTIKDMQRLIEIKNQNLADLQKQAAAKPADVAKPAPAKPDVVNPPATTTTTTTTETKASSVTAVAPPAAPVAAPPAVAPAVPAVKDVPKPAAPKPAAKEVKTVTPPAVERSFLDEITDNPVYIAVGSVLLGLIALAVIAMRRKKDSTGFEDSIITGGDLKANTVFGNTGGGVVNTGDNSFITDFSREGLAAADTDEVDPIAEAEVYMAYGRDSQAEEILKDALQKDPNRFEIYTKLLEIYAGRKNATAFETLASELYAATGGQGEDWAKAAEMGRALDAENPLYSGTVVQSHNEAVVAAAAIGAAAAGVVAAHEIDPDKTVVMSRSALVSEPAKEDFNIPDMPVANPSSDLDFDLDFDSEKKAAPAKTSNDFSFDMDMPAQPEKAEPVKADNGALDFDLGSFNDAPVTAAKPSEPSFNLDDGLAFDLGAPDKVQPKPVEVVAMTPVKPAPSDLDFDFKVEPAVQTSTQAPEIDLSGIDLNLEGAPAEDEIQFDTDTPSPDAHWQEVATKLDLARAYQEMGDNDGAREILQEVMHEGDDQQKGDAKAVLAKLG